MKKGLTKEQFTNWAISKGWKPDKWGHLRNETKEYRLRVTRIAVRYEVKARLTGYTQWIRLGNGYLEDLEITPEDELKGLTL